MKKKRRTAAVFLSVVIMALTACGNSSSDIQETVAPVENEIEETEEEAAVEESEKEEIEEAEAPIIPYADANELEFCEDLTVAVKGVRIDINEPSVYEEVDAECVITDISIEEMEDGTRSITIKYEVTGEVYDDREKRLLQAVMPHAAHCDLNTGEFYSVGGEIFWDNGKEIDYAVEWDGETYNIIQTKTIEWTTGLDWKPDGKSGYVKPVTMYATDTFIVPKDYNSMGMVIGMFTAEETYSGEYELFKDNQPSILEVLENREDARLYSINELCKLFSEDEVVADTNVNADNNNTDSADNGGYKENTNNNSPKESTTSKQEQQTTHTHSYASSVTKNPTCSEAGVRTYTCSCGSSYTEAIPASGHQWVTTTETISHPSTGHYETVTKKEIWCSCGASGFQSMAEYNAHAENCSAFGSGVTERTENVWVVDSDSWEETITINKCSVCGINQ